MIVDVVALLVLVILAYMLGFENSSSVKGSVRCRIAGHKYAQGIPATKCKGFVAWMFCTQCGTTMTSINTLEVTDAER